MNVYIRSVAERLAGQGVEVDLFTRCRGGSTHDVREIAPGIRVVSAKAGPCQPIPKSAVQRYLPEFLGGVLRVARENGNSYDLIHSHYWLSGWVGRAAKDILGVPLVASFHTLGKVKNYSLARGETPEPSERLRGEERVIREADRILAPTPEEAGQLVGLYGAEPDRVRIVPPGVDHRLFRPRDRGEARARLHLSGLRLALFVGRLQSHKGPDVAIRTIAEVAARSPVLAEDLVLAIVGGPSGEHAGAEVARLMELASALGVADRVMLFPPQPHERLADFYSAADVVLVPSRSESFGLVALEAQACGTPVVAAAVGGLRTVVRGGGLLVEGHDAADHAEAVLAVLGDPTLVGEPGRGRRPRVPRVHLGRDDHRGPRRLPRARRDGRVIHGTRVVLRPVEERDHALIHAWQNDPEVWWLMDYEGPFSMQDIAESEQRAREEGHPYMIEVDGTPIGRIGLNSFRRRDRICSLYILIGERSAWEQGYGTDAVAALVDEAFDRYDLHRVELWSTADNERAIHVYEKCGFVVDGRLPERSWKGGAWVDRVVMSVTREALRGVVHRR